MIIKIAKTKVLPIESIGFLKSNRGVQQNHVQKMYNLIEDNGFADTIKVFTNKGRYYALEGQHRLEALKLHGIDEIPCSVVDWVKNDFEDLQSFIIDLNAHNKSWNIYDYVKSWSENRKNPKNNLYKHLRNQMIAYSKTLSNGVVATCYDGIARSHTPLKEGKLSFLDREFSDELVDTLSQMVAKYGKSKLPAQVLRHAAVEMVKFDGDKYRLLRSFKLGVVNHIETSEQPLPDGDDIFKHWFKNVIINIIYENKR